MISRVYLPHALQQDFLGSTNWNDFTPLCRSRLLPVSILYTMVDKELLLLFKYEMIRYLWSINMSQATKGPILLAFVRYKYMY